MLKYADPSKPFILTTDTSDIVISGVLSQLDENNKERE